MIRSTNNRRTPATTLPCLNTVLAWKPTGAAITSTINLTDMKYQKDSIVEIATNTGHLPARILNVDPEFYHLLLPDGRGIVIEQRAAEEVTHVGGQPIAPAGAEAFNPAFDVTPADLVTAIVTEGRVFKGPEGHA